MFAQTIAIKGYVTGKLWWPNNVDGYKRIDRTVTIPRGGGTLRDVVLVILDAENGDFSTAAQLTADTSITFERVTYDRTRRRATRTYDVTDFRSIADLVSELAATD